MNIKTVFTAFALLVFALLEGCTVVPLRPVYSGGVEVRTTGPFHYPAPPMYRYPGYAGNDPRIQTKEDEQGLVSFQVSQSGLTEPEVDWLLRKVEELKARCANGGEMKRYEIRSVERANPYSSRTVRGDTSVNIAYQCNRGSGSYRTPSAREPAPSAPRSKYLLPT